MFRRRQRWFFLGGACSLAACGLASSGTGDDTFPPPVEVLDAGSDDDDDALDAEAPPATVDAAVHDGGGGTPDASDRCTPPPSLPDASVIPVDGAVGGGPSISGPVYFGSYDLVRFDDPSGEFGHVGGRFELDEAGTYRHALTYELDGTAPPPIVEVGRFEVDGGLLAFPDACLGFDGGTELVRLLDGGADVRPAYRVRFRSPDGGVVMMTYRRVAP